METFALYLLKSVAWLTGFTLVFILFLRNERFFVINRIYLIAGILISFLFPLISIHYTVVLPAIKTFQIENAVAVEVQSSSGSIISYLELMLLFLYVTGILFVLTIMLRQGRSVLKAIRRSEIIKVHPAKLIRTTDYTSAFSFFSYVFVNPSITDVETKEIMNHELVHIRQKHWFDLLLGEMLCMMQWFNPLAWIYFRFIRQNHEYLADEVALQRTSNPAIYRAALLNQIVGFPVVSLANSFNYSLNKKRFNMMKNIISSPYRKMKILFILPVFAIVFYAFAKPDYKYNYVDESSGKIISAASLQQKSVRGKVVQNDGTPLPGATIIVKGTTTGTSADATGSFKIDNVPDNGLLVISFVGFKPKVLKPVFTSEMAINMVKDTVKYLNLNISTPPPPPSPIGLKFKGNGPIPLFFVDGNIVTENEAENIDPNLIEAVNVLKDKSAIDKYGEKGKDGVIEITTKERASMMLVIIDGVIYEKDGMSKINTDNVKSMDVLKGKSAIEKYGEKGKYGAIEVTNYKKGEKKSEGTIAAVTPGDPKTDKEPFVVVEEMPQFPGGGNDAMVAWIIANLKYPGEAVKEKITGKVLVNFTVSAKGKVKDVVVSKPVHPLLDAEARRVISSMPDWKPGIQAGKPVPVQIMVPVEFILK
jgi:TonB family protein